MPLPLESLVHNCPLRGANSRSIQRLAYQRGGERDAMVSGDEQERTSMAVKFFPVGEMQSGCKDVGRVSIGRHWELPGSV